MLSELEADVIRDPEQTGREIFFCTVRKDISRMVYQQVQEAIKGEVAKKLTEHEEELRLQVDRLVVDSIKNMKISIPSLTLTLSAHEEGDYE